MLGVGSIPTARSSNRAISARSADIADTSCFQKLREKQSESWTISDEWTDNVSGKPTFVIASRIVNKDALQGVLSATIDIGDLGAHLLSTHRQQEGVISVFDSGGVLVYDSSDDAPLPDVAR